MRLGTFCWYELVTTDASAAETFYADVAGWTMRDSGMSGIRYTLAHAGDTPVGGLMTLPEEARANGAPPRWLGYVAVDDVDSKLEALTDAGGKEHRAPQDIPGIGRFAVVADPQGAPFVLFRGNGSPPPGPAAGTPGHMGWHELHTSDWEAAFSFYSRLFGWTKSTAMDMGPMGTYQIIAIDGMDAGAMFNSPRGGPSWLYYINVADIDAASARITAGGGTIAFGPQEVPGGTWIIQAKDPQGVLFALAGSRPASKG